MSIFVGIDIETTGTNPAIHAMCQIGAAYIDPETSIQRMYVQGVRPPDHAAIDPGAMIINKLSVEILNTYPLAAEVEQELLAFIPDTTEKLIAVGWNVGSFDMQFVKRTMLDFSTKFHYRTVELNSICFALAEATGSTLEEWKVAANNYAEEQLRQRNQPPQWHSAGYDAAASLWSFKYLVSAIG